MKMGLSRNYRRIQLVAGAQKDMAKLIHELETQGWKRRKNSGGHIILVAPNGHHVSFSMSPRSGRFGRSLVRAKADVKRVLSL